MVTPTGIYPVISLVVSANDKPPAAGELANSVLYGGGGSSDDVGAQCNARRGSECRTTNGTKRGQRSIHGNGQVAALLRGSALPQAVLYSSMQGRHGALAWFARGSALTYCTGTPVLL